LIDKLEARYGFYGCLTPGSDCWGFRPDISVQNAADIVGIVLAKGYQEWFYQIGGENIKVYGREKSESDLSSKG
jgi:hypothetical protein